MSLDELLKEPEEGSLWKKQRAKLLRVAAGMAVALVAVLVGAALFFGLRPPRQAALEQKGPAPEELARLLRLRREVAGTAGDLGARAPATAGVPVGARGTAGAGADTHVVSYDPGDGFTSLAAAKSDVYIPTGAVFQAQMLTPIKTSVARTFVMAETTQEFRMDMKRRIARGSRLVGRSYFDPVLKGVVVEFDTLVSPQGKETALSGLALSRNALPELEGLYFSNYMTTYGTALAFGFLSGFSDAAQQREFTLLGSQPQVTLGNQVLNGLSTASFQVAEQMLRDIQTRAIEYVVVPAGEQVFVVLTRRYDLAQGGPK